MIGSWWPSSSEEMTCVSSAMTVWVAHPELGQLFYKESNLWWHSGACRAPQSSLMISPFKVDRSLEQNNKALWTEPWLFQCVSVSWGHTRLHFLASSVIPKNKSPFHEAKNSSGINSASSLSCFLPFFLKFPCSHLALSSCCSNRVVHL